MLLRVEITPQTAFGSEILGETLFGQLCWTICHLYGENQLSEYLGGYTTGRPFAIISDAFPHNYLPIPTLPSFMWNDSNVEDRKYLKAKHWIARNTALSLPLLQWRNEALTDAELFELLEVDDKKQFKFYRPEVTLPRIHNTISRLTNTTGTGRFAPYTGIQTWFSPKLHFDIYVVADDRFNEEKILTCFEYIGMTGFGRDASIGLGKFIVSNIEKIDSNPKSNQFLTLSSASICGLDLTKESYYRTKTHFGRHGDRMTHSANPFKKPLLLAERGAILTLKQSEKTDFLGQGISGVSLSQPCAVHQGYAPVLAITEFSE